MLAYLIQGIGYGFAASVQPGPLQTFIISQTLKNGWRRTLPAALAPLISDGPILILILFVLSQVPGWFQKFLYIAGGLFILYLAWGAWKAWRSFDATSPAVAHSGQQSMFKAALTNLLNPGPYIYWSLVTGPILVAGWRETPLNGFGFLLGFYCTIVAGLVATILLFGAARQLGPKVNRAVLGLSVIALAGFGVYQLWRGLAAIAAG
jgi:threonine/homoserine/homoserine lactone efflux protein